MTAEASRAWSGSDGAAEGTGTGERTEARPADGDAGGEGGEPREGARRRNRGRGARSRSARRRERCRRRTARARRALTPMAAASAHRATARRAKSMRAARATTRIGRMARCADANVGRAVGRRMGDDETSRWRSAAIVAPAAAMEPRPTTFEARAAMPDATPAAEAPASPGARASDVCRARCGPGLALCAADGLARRSGRVGGPRVGELGRRQGAKRRRRRWPPRRSRFTCRARSTPVAAVDEGPLVMVETRKDLSQVKLPFETTPRESQGL